MSLLFIIYSILVYWLAYSLLLFWLTISHSYGTGTTRPIMNIYVSWRCPQVQNSYAVLSFPRNQFWIHLPALTSSAEPESQTTRRRNEPVIIKKNLYSLLSFSLNTLCLSILIILSSTLTNTLFSFWAHYNPCLHNRHVNFPSSILLLRSLC